LLQGPKLPDLLWQVGQSSATRQIERLQVLELPDLLWQLGQSALGQIELLQQL
jgi:hypothetical protein